MRKPTSLSQQQLKKFSGEHLYYEIKMLYSVYDLLASKVNDKIVFNSLIESFVLHTNILLDFFYLPKMKADDAKAIHYIKDVAEWKKRLPAFDKYFRRFHRRRSRELVHLSYKRLEVTGADKAWSHVRTTKHIKKVVDLFLDMADPQVIHPKLYQLKTDQT